MKKNVGIVIVSHSLDVAKGTADMVRKMVGTAIPLAFCGGNADGTLGTSIENILAAIDAAWSDRGVAILVDLGGAETTARWRLKCSLKTAAARWLCAMRQSLKVPLWRQPRLGVEPRCMMYSARLKSCHHNERMAHGFSGDQS